MESEERMEADIPSKEERGIMTAGSTTSNTNRTYSSDEVIPRTIKVRRSTWLKLKQAWVAYGTLDEFLSKILDEKIEEIDKKIEEKNIADMAKYAKETLANAVKELRLEGNEHNWVVWACFKCSKYYLMGIASIATAKCNECNKNLVRLGVLKEMLER